jgi:uncharacterized membrane protein YhaH (DUF805 family)
MYWYFKVFKQFTNFKGRASRKEYWMFCLFSSLFTLAAVSVDIIFFDAVSKGSIFRYGSIAGVYINYNYSFYRSSN